MVALLRYAGKKRRQMANTAEDEVVYLAMRDMNIARFTSDDLPLFNGIMSDIFPGTLIPTVDYMDINFAISDFMEENNLQVFTGIPYNELHIQNCLTHSSTYLFPVEILLSIIFEKTIYPPLNSTIRFIFSN